MTTSTDHEQEFTTALLSYAAHQLHQAAKERDRLVCRGRALGVPVAKLADAASLTGPGIRRILARSEPSGG